MKKNFKFLLLIPAVIAPLLIGCGKGSNEKTIDFAFLRNNFQNILIANTNINNYKDKTKEEIKSEFASETISGLETYKFKDIDYVGPFSRSSFPPCNHLNRALAIAIVAKNRNDEELKEYVRKLEYNWAFNNYRSPNWYDNEIAVVRSLTNVAMFEYDNLNEKGKEALKGKIRNGSIYYHPGLEQHQGANLIDYAQNTFKNGILEKNSKETDYAFNRLMEEIKENDKEGFQTEGSYFQHGRLLSTGSYGNTATSKLGDFFTALKGSNYIVPHEKIQIILNCILVGLKYMTQREYKNWMCQGRGFCGKNPYKYKTDSLQRFLSIDGVTNEDKEKLQDFFNKHDAGKPCFNDTRVFPKARIITSNINGVYIAFKGCDPITVNTECLNNENELAYNLSYGMNTAIMQSGLEYENLSPVCDFSFMPGATSQNYGFNSLEVTEEQKFYRDGDKAIFEKTAALKNERFEDKVASFRNDGNKYIYGMADDLANSKIACCYQQGKHSNKIVGDKEFKGQEFTVACFSTPKGMAILGAGMRDLDNEQGNPRYVTLQQCVIKEDYDNVDLVGASVRHNYKNTNKGIDTNVYYKLLNADTNITLRKNEVKGNWQRNHSVAKAEDITEKTMVAYAPIDQYDKYAYSIQTDNANDFLVAINNEDVQAIEYDNKVIACFYNKDKAKQTFKYQDKDYQLTNSFIDGEGAFQIFDK